MQIQPQQPTSTTTPPPPKPQNMLLLQTTFQQSRIFPVHSLPDALQKMIKIYGQVMTLKASSSFSSNPQTPDTVRFCLKQMTTYYANMENIMYMERDNLTGDKQKEKHKTQLQSFDKEFVLASLKAYCVKKSTERSIELAKEVFKSGQDLGEVLGRMGFTV